MTFDISTSMQPISKDTIHRLCAGQVIVDLSTTVKELLENSLDAESTHVELKLKDSGLTSITVSDNGHGISEDNFATLCRKHWTSKITQFEDLEHVETFGFRGEALSSLCAVADVAITTATRDSAPVGIELKYDQGGELVSQTTVARERGTTVQLTNLFAKWPVRQQDLKKNIRREYLRLVALVEQYAIISDSVRLSLTNQTRSGSSVAVRTLPQNDRLTRLLTVFGTQSRPHIVHFARSFTDSDNNDNDKDGSDAPVDLDLDLKLDGHISKAIPEAGRSGADKQYFFVNGRPCDFPKAKKLINELYRHYSPTKYPVYAIAISINAQTIDVNLSPDKRSILIRHEPQVLDALRRVLTQVLEPSESVFSVGRVQTQITSVQAAGKTADGDAALKAGVEEEEEKQVGVVQREAVEWARTITAETSVPGVIRCYADDSSETEPRKRAAVEPPEPSTLLQVSTKPKLDEQIQRPTNTAEPVSSKNTRSVIDSVPLLPMIPPSLNQQPSPPSKPRQPSKPPSAEPRKAAPTASSNAHKPPKRLQTMVIGNCRNRMQNDTHDWSNTHSRMKAKHARHTRQLEESQKRELGIDMDIVDAEVEQGGVKNASNPDQAASALSRLIHKTDFAQMSIIGQFNHGFIIARLAHDLYIIDQHASDEKYNFEQLQQRAVIASQPLIRPTTLELSVVDEGVAIDFQDTLMRNGFHIRVDENEVPGRRVSLMSQPFIDQTLFNQGDLMELIGKLCVSPESMPRCERARKMFASRACRKSIMIGDPLGTAQMKNVVHHLSELDHPWNCPHGRPTMRHLYRLVL
ncbi:ATP-binding mismatch repair protein [Coemansia sp. RSA 2618]|nr:ATP-binding mismatch repair protein [Coemansia sp. RSA 2618]